MIDDKKTVIRSDGSSNPRYDVEIVSMSGLRIVLVRMTRVYLQSFLAALGVLGLGLENITGMNIPVGDFITAVKISSGVAIAPAFISLCWNALEILTNLDVTNPKLRA